MARALQVLAITAAAVLRGQRVEAQPVRPDPVKRAPLAPTPEQQAKAPYKRVTVHTGTDRVLAYRREPWFETLARRSDVTDDQLRALRFYRDAFESSQRSEIKCALDQTPRGQGGGVMPMGQLIAADNVRACEAGMGMGVHTLRAIALRDKRYADVAMERWGSREQEWLVEGQFRTRSVPKSGRHPAAIKAEFGAVLRLLEANVEPLVSTVRRAA